MKKLFIIASIAIGCSDPPVAEITFKRYCGVEHSESVAKFIVDCATAANPKSDEEGEDLVKQCQKTSEEVLCPEVAHVKWSTDISYLMFQPCTQKNTNQAFQTACAPYLQ